jgi:uncharacterized damage-inducible protein DinB
MTKAEFALFRRYELPKTIKLLRMYPEEKKDLKPSPIIRSAIETLGTFIAEEAMSLSYARTGTFDMAKFQRTTPSTMAEGIAKLEALVAETDAALAQLSEEGFHKMVDAFGRPMPLSAFLFTMMLDHIHHRGQFTIYSRMAGGKVPQIYGPSADEPMQPAK